MTDTEPNRLGLRGHLNLLNSTLRLIGAANATGAIASAVAFQASNGNTDIQSSMLPAGIAFLLGVLFFSFAYVFWFLTVLDIDHSLRAGEKEGMVNEFFSTIESAEAYLKKAKHTFVVMVLLGLSAFVAFLFGFVLVLQLSIGLYLSSVMPLGDI